MASKEIRPDHHDSHEELMDAIQQHAGPRVLEAMALVDRQKFIDGRQRTLAYHDYAVHIPGYKDESSVSQPRTVAFMTRLLDVQPTDTVLEIGAASGYQAAILSHLADTVVSVEYIPELAKKAKKRLHNMGINNVHIVIADGSRLFTAKDTFDKILVTASLPPFPIHDLFDALKLGGKIITPIGGVKGQPTRCDISVLEKQDDGMIELQRYPDFTFVPMHGQYGWEGFFPYAIDTFNTIFHNVHSSSNPDIPSLDKNS